MQVKQNVKQSVKNSPVIVYRDKFPYNQGSPAKVSVETGLIEINTPIFNLYPKHVQDWIIRHEKGHYYNDTLNEIKADSYALETADPKNKNSLYEAIEAVKLVVPKNKERQDATILMALKIAANEGNPKAKKILGKFANATGENEQPDQSFITWLFIGALVIIFTIILFNYAK